MDMYNAGIDYCLRRQGCALQSAVNLANAVQADSEVGRCRASTRSSTDKGKPWQRGEEWGARGRGEAEAVEEFVQKRTGNVSGRGGHFFGRGADGE